MICTELHPLNFLLLLVHFLPLLHSLVPLLLEGSGCDFGLWVV